MARPPKGKPLTLRPIRLDDDVWAECQRLGKEHGTINEGLRKKILPFGGDDIPVTREEVLQRAVEAQKRTEAKGWRGFGEVASPTRESGQGVKRRLRDSLDASPKAAKDSLKPKDRKP